MSDLWHYTCAHAIGAILADGMVIPRPQPVLGGRSVSWWTDIDWPTSPESLGLTSHILSCNRMECRVQAGDITGIVPWTRWVRQAAGVHRRLLEVPGTLPAHWFVTGDAVPIVGGQ